MANRYILGEVRGVPVQGTPPEHGTEAAGHAGHTVLGAGPDRRGPQLPQLTLRHLPEVHRVRRTIPGATVGSCGPEAGHHQGETQSITLYSRTSIKGHSE